MVCRSNNTCTSKKLYHILYIFCLNGKSMLGVQYKQKELNTNFVALVEILIEQDSNSNLHSSIVTIFAP